MAVNATYKALREGIRFSVVDLNDVQHLYATAVPRHGSTFRQQVGDVLRNIEAVNQEEGARGSIVYQAVYVADVGLIDECRQIVRDFYGRELPATTYVPQPPCGGMPVAIEALGVGAQKGEGRDRTRERATRRPPIRWDRMGPLRAGRSSNSRGKRLRR